MTAKSALDPKKVQNPKWSPRECPKLIFCLSQAPFDFVKILLVKDLAFIDKLVRILIFFDRTYGVDVIS